MMNTLAAIEAIYANQALARMTGNKCHVSRSSASVLVLDT